MGSRAAKRLKLPPKSCVFGAVGPAAAEVLHRSASGEGGWGGRWGHRVSTFTINNDDFDLFKVLIRWYRVFEYILKETRQISTFIHSKFM